VATLTFLQAINQALRQEMERDDRVLVLGEDVGVNGGVFRATEGLLDAFGPTRVIDTPLNECGIVASALGMAIYGLRPVAEMEFLDFIYPGFDQIVNEVAKFRYRTGGQWHAPLVIRAPSGAGIKGGHYHSQSTEAYFAHTAGLKVVMPATPTDAKGLLVSAIRDEDPVIFLEPKKLYRALREEVPDGLYATPLGQARLAREGRDVSLITFGAMVHIALEAAERAAAEGIDVEVVDLRTLVPLDEEAVLASVGKTGRVVVLHEAARTCGFGAELAALVAEKALLQLQAPVVRVTGFDTPVPVAHEERYLPDAFRILEAIRQVKSF
jgi:2-oxoisovalerate dehydrogenase E1 component beta subunit